MKIGYLMDAGHLLSNCDLTRHFGSFELEYIKQDIVGEEKYL